MYVIISIQRWSWLVGSYFGLLFYGQQKVYFDYYKQNYPVSRIIDNKEVAVVQGHFYRPIKAWRRIQGIRIIRFKEIRSLMLISKSYKIKLSWLELLKFLSVEQHFNSVMDYERILYL